MAVGVRSEDGGVEAPAALGDDRVEVGKRGEVPTDGRLVAGRPQPLGGLEFRAAGRQEHQADPLGDGQAFGPVPAGGVEHEGDAAAAPRPGPPREGRGERFAERLASQNGSERPVDRCQAASPRAGRTQAVASATRGGGGRARRDARRRAPTPAPTSAPAPGAGPAPGRGGARPRPGPRPAGRDAPPGPGRPPCRAACGGSPRRGRGRARGPRRLERPAEPRPGVPAAWRLRPRQAGRPRPPGGGLGTAPPPASLARQPRAAPAPAQPRRPTLPRPAGRAPGRCAAAQRPGPGRVAARGQPRHPARRAAQRPGRLEGPPRGAASRGRLEQRPALRQQPDRLAAPRCRGVPRRPVPPFQPLDGQRLDEPCQDPAPEPWPARMPDPRQRRSLPRAVPTNRIPYQASPARRAGHGRPGQPARPARPAIPPCRAERPGTGAGLDGTIPARRTVL